ncbi:unnamed protein product [Mytilus coruscus]|uniref:Uncharacterized protein n=1 Tax=Mytilus coruscus TaxID=42192 RepID=A0A6J8D253_MYTCO|nr:unnamed protein product [Mytilus coruscus]
MDAGSPGLLNIPLDAFASMNKGKDVKLSIDGKKVALGLGELGDENLGGHEMQLTLQERKDRPHTKVDNLNNSAFLLNDKKSDGIAQFIEIKEQSKNVMKQSFLISITHLSKRIQELRDFVVKRKIHLQNLMKMVDGDWKQSKLSGAISYWQTKLIQAQSHIGELLESIDKLGYLLHALMELRTIIYLEQKEQFCCNIRQITSA